MSSRKKKKCKKCKKAKLIKAFGKCDACYSRERYNAKKQVEFLERQFEREFMNVGTRGRKR